MKLNKKTVIATCALLFLLLTIYLLSISKGVIWGYKDYNYFLETVDQNEVNHVEYDLDQPKSGDNLILYVVRKDGSSFQVMTPYQNDRELKPLLEKNYIHTIETATTSKPWWDNQYVILIASLIVYIAPVLITLILFVGLILLFMINSKLKKIEKKISNTYLLVENYEETNK